MTKKALISGITGQDGSYLAELLLDKGYEVHGLIRRASTFNTERIDHLYVDPHRADARLFLHYGDLADGSGLVRLLHRLQPDEVYHLGAQSHVRVSFDMPEYTGDVTGLGHDPAARGAPRRRGERPLLPGVSRRRCSARHRRRRTRSTPFYPRSPVRRREGVRVLDDQELPRGVRHVRGQRDPVQPRVAATR